MVSAPIPSDIEFLRNYSGPFLGLDVGNVRIGVAVSDSGGVLARPLVAVLRAPRKSCLDRLEQILEETGAKGIVLGLPRLENGGEGEQVQQTRAFARSLQARIPGIALVWWDERYTSSEADEIMRQTKSSYPASGLAQSDERRRGKGRPPSDSRGRRDEIAAAVLLQEWLDERRRRTP